MCEVVVMISKVPIVTCQFRSTSSLFTIQMAQNVNLSTPEPDLQFILEYYVVFNEV